MKIDVVFSGGGVKPYAFVEAFQSIKNNILHIGRIAGTAAGANIASFIAVRFQADEINKLLYELDFPQFLDAPKPSKLCPVSKWLLLCYQMGLYRGD